jgi:hypothetical protein
MPMTAKPPSNFEETKRLMIKGGLLRENTPMIPDFDKPAGERCRHQRYGKGCAVYGRRPFGCRLWSCRWLVGEDTEHLRRPDRSHYVIDMTPDFVTWVNNETREEANVPVLQIWIDPGYPLAHEDPDLRAYVDKYAREGVAALVRYNAHEAILLIAPSMSNDGRWHEVRTNAKAVAEHTAEDKARVLGPLLGMMIVEAER